VLLSLSSYNFHGRIRGLFESMAPPYVLFHNPFLLQKTGRSPTQKKSSRPFAWPNILNEVGPLSRALNTGQCPVTPVHLSCPSEIRILSHECPHHSIVISFQPILIPVIPSTETLALYSLRKYRHLKNAYPPSNALSNP
jgi:hypothetical protein